MVRVCPQSTAWHQVHKRLVAYARHTLCRPAEPPAPLILNGWVFSNDVERIQRCQEMVEWATRNGCAELVANVEAKDFYVVTEPTSYDVGPHGGPTHLRWNHDAKERPSADDLRKSLETLKARWTEVAGTELAAATAPVEFSGEKARCLIVSADPGVTPPWGGCFELSPIEAKRRTFTRLRSGINETVAPHEVDHVVFDAELWKRVRTSEATS